MKWSKTEGKGEIYVVFSETYNFEEGGEGENSS